MESLGFLLIVCAFVFFYITETEATKAFLFTVSIYGTMVLLFYGLYLLI